MKNDLSRQFFLDVTANGAVFIRERGSVISSAALPAFSTDTYEQAQMLQVRHCRLANDCSGVYLLNECPADLDALKGVTRMFRASYEATCVPPPG